LHCTMLVLHCHARGGRIAILPVKNLGLSILEFYLIAVKLM
jgi:hypothetical protein